MGHVFNAVSLVSHGLDVEEVIILKQPENVLQGIVEPRVAFGYQHPGGFLRAKQGSRFGRDSRWLAEAASARRHLLFDCRALATLFLAKGDHILRSALPIGNSGANVDLRSRLTTFRWKFLFRRQVASFCHDTTGTAFSNASSAPSFASNFGFSFLRHDASNFCCPTRTLKSLFSSYHIGQSFGGLVCGSMAP